MSSTRTSARPIRITVCGYSDRGRVRSENQDHFLIADLSRAPEDGGLLLQREPGAGGGGGAARTSRRAPARSQTFTLGAPGALALVADGMGGAVAGELASRLAVSWIYEEFATRVDISDAAAHPTRHRQFAHSLREAVVLANTRLYRESRRDPRHEGMGTTATVAGVLEDTLYLAQVGDSRAYLVRQGAAHQLTRDQSLVQNLIDAGALTPEEANRSGKRNIILQALGPEPRVQVDLTSQQLRRGDTLVISSDGLHGTVTAPEIAGRSTSLDPAAACTALISLANERGGEDNITVIVMHFDGTGLPEPQPGDTVERRLLS